MQQALESQAPQRRRRATVAFGWIVGGALGFLTNYFVYLGWGPSYPVLPTTFALVVLGCAGGMAIAEVLGHRAFRPLGILAGLLFSALTVGTLLALTRAPAPTASETRRPSE